MPEFWEIWSPTPSVIATIWPDWMTQLLSLSRRRWKKKDTQRGAFVKFPRINPLFLLKRQHLFQQVGGGGQLTMAVESLKNLWSCAKFVRLMIRGTKSSQIPDWGMLPFWKSFKLWNYGMRKWKVELWQADVFLGKAFKRDLVLPRITIMDLKSLPRFIFGRSTLVPLHIRQWPMRVRSQKESIIFWPIFLILNTSNTSNTYEAQKKLRENLKRVFFWSHQTHFLPDMSFD